MSQGFDRLALDRATLGRVRAHRRAASTSGFTRYENLAWALARGMPHARCEPRVHEGNLPNADSIWDALGGSGEKRNPEQMKEISSWCTVSEERIKRFGPHVARARPVGLQKPPCLYLAVRADLSHAQQAVQAAHALQQFNLEHPSEARAWAESSNAIALVSVPSEGDLHELAKRAASAKICSSLFCEPDLQGQKTALALEPRGKKLCRDLPLALA